MGKSSVQKSTALSKTKSAETSSKNLTSRRCIGMYAIASTQITAESKFHVDEIDELPSYEAYPFLLKVRNKRLGKETTKEYSLHLSNP